VPRNSTHQRQLTANYPLCILNAVLPVSPEIVYLNKVGLVAREPFACPMIG